MKNFLFKHFLFDKSYGLMGYFWLIALLFFSIQMVITTPRQYRIAEIILLLIFAKFYRDSYFNDKWQIPKVLIQFLIMLIVSAWSMNSTLYIFSAWQIGSMTISQKRFIQYTVIFWLFCAFDICWAFYGSQIGSIYDLMITIFFSIGSPLAARSLKNTYRRRAQLSQSNQRLETVIRQSERSRIAKDLHDNLGQSLSLITLKAELAEKLMTKDTEKAAKELQDIADTSRQNLSVVRNIVADLNKQTIAEAMIIEEKNLDTAKIFMNTKNEDISSQWPADIQTVLAAVIKEASTNILRYSKANTANLIFQEDDSNYYLDIHDNGIGIDNPRQNSFGISGMTNRIQSINGTLEIKSLNGTDLNISIPKENLND